MFLIIPAQVSREDLLRVDLSIRRPRQLLRSPRRGDARPAAAQRLRGGWGDRDLGQSRGNPEALPSPPGEAEEQAGEQPRATAQRPGVVEDRRERRRGGTDLVVGCEVSCLALLRVVQAIGGGGLSSVPPPPGSS